MSIISDEISAINIPQLIIVYSLRYISYVFLTYPVCFVAFSLLFMAVTFINGEVSMEWLSNLAFLNPMFKDSSYTIGISEIMQVYGFISLVFWIVLIGVKKSIELIIKREICISFKTRIRVSLIVLSLVFLADVMTWYFSKGYTLSFLLVIFFIVAAVNMVLSIIVNYFSHRIPAFEKLGVEKS